MDLLELFDFMLNNIPAYKTFLEDQGIDPTAVREPANIPIMTKANYIEKYSLWDRIKPDCEPALLTKSSGTTGAPVVWPVARSYIDVLTKTAHSALSKLNPQYNLLVCVSLDISRWYAGLTALALGVKLGDMGKVTIIKTEIDLSELEKILDSSNFNMLFLVTYPETTEKQVQQLLGLPGLPDIIAVLVATGKISRLNQKKLQTQANSINKKLSFIFAYGSSDAGIVGISGIISPTGLVSFPKHIEDKIINYYDPRDATVFSPLPTCHIEIIDKIIHLSNIQNSVPLLRYNTNDRGGKIDDDQLAHPLYWIDGRATDQLNLKGATINLAQVKQYISNKFSMHADDIIITKNKSEKVYPLWKIKFETTDDINTDALAEKITDIVIENSYEARIRVESGMYQKNIFEPQIEITC